MNKGNNNDQIQTNNQLGNTNQTNTNNYSLPNKKTIVWESVINEKKYKFNCQFKTSFQYNLSINDSEPMSLINKGIGKIFNTIISGFEESFVFDNINMRLVIPSNLWSNSIKNADVVVDNKFSRTGKEYVVAPKWVYIFIVLCLLIVVGGGAIPFLLAFSGITGCLKVAKSNKSTGIKVISCIGITLAVWIAFLLVVVIVSSST